jgi:hypothetical protein
MMTFTGHPNPSTNKFGQKDQVVFHTGSKAMGSNIKEPKYIPQEFAKKTIQKQGPVLPDEPPKRVSV